VADVGVLLNNEIRHNNKNCRKLYPTIPYNNPDSDIGWKNTAIVIKQEKRKYPNITKNITTELTDEYPVNINALLRKNF